MLDDPSIGGKEAVAMPGTDPRDLYPLYLAFQSRLQEYAAVTCRTEFARAHYRRVFRPEPLELFEARLVRWPAGQLADQVRVWRSGFEVWLEALTRDACPGPARA